MNGDELRGQLEAVPVCDMCETRHSPSCGQTMAEGLLKMTPEQYFDWIDGGNASADEEAF